MMVGPIIEEILDRQEQDRVDKLFKKVGKPFSSKTALQNTLAVMKNFNWDSFSFLINMCMLIKS